MRNEIDRQSVNKTTLKEWLAGFNMGPPIDSQEIPDFQHWVNFNGFSPRHDGYDFAAYLTKSGKVIPGRKEYGPVELEIGNSPLERGYSHSIVAGGLVVMS